jgi:hypothetical protein
MLFYELQLEQRSSKTFDTNGNTTTYGFDSQCNMTSLTSVYTTQDFNLPIDRMGSDILIHPGN